MRLLCHSQCLFNTVVLLHPRPSPRASIDRSLSITAGADWPATRAASGNKQPQEPHHVLAGYSGGWQESDQKRFSISFFEVQSAHVRVALDLVNRSELVSCVPHQRVSPATTATGLCALTVHSGIRDTIPGNNKNNDDMDNEIPLPPPPRRKPRPSRFDECSSQPSSDPALFSSDDIPAGLENYHASAAGGAGAGAGGGVGAAGAAGRKRRYRGTWWGETVMDPKRKRQQFKDKRFVDSGVWLGSDESLGGSSFLASEDAPGWGEDLFRNARSSTAATAAAEERHVPDAVPEPNSMMRAQQATVQLRAAFKRVEEPQEYQLARAIINDCLEKGQDSVDLRWVIYLPEGFHLVCVR